MACEDGENQEQTPKTGWSVPCPDLDPDTLLCECFPAVTCRAGDFCAERLAALLKVIYTGLVLCK